MINVVTHRTIAIKTLNFLPSLVMFDRIAISPRNRKEVIHSKRMQADSFLSVT